MCVCERERENVCVDRLKVRKFIYFQNLFASTIFQLWTVNWLTNFFYFLQTLQNQMPFLILNKLKTLTLFLSVNKNQLIFTQFKYLSIFFVKMPKCFSTRGRATLEDRLAAPLSLSLSHSLSLSSSKYDKPDFLPRSDLSNYVRSLIRSLSLSLSHSLSLWLKIWWTRLFAEVGFIKLRK